MSLGRCRQTALSIDIRAELVSSGSRLLFTVTSDDGPHYWRLLSLPTFDGSSWNPPEEDLTDVDGGSSIDGVTSTSTQRFAIAALGGPIAKDKTHFYGAYEYVNRSLVTGGQVITVTQANADAGGRPGTRACRGRPDAHRRAA